MGHFSKFVQRFGLRVVIVYFVLYALPFPLMWQRFEFWNTIDIWFGKNVLHLQSVPVTWPTGSGDTLINYLDLAIFGILSVLLSLIWMSLDRRPLQGKWHRAFRHYLRFYLATSLCYYGFAKVFPPGQFGTLGSPRLIESYGSASPMGLLWTFMAASRAYTFFGGLMEVVAGLLLFVPQTVTVGALLSAAVMTNVFLLNMCYDVPVKLYSFHLLLCSLILILPEIKRLTQFFVLNEKVDPAPSASVGRWFLINQTVIAGVILGFVVFQNLQVGDRYLETIRKTPFYGSWNVRNFDGALADHWAQLGFDTRGRLFVRSESGSGQQWEVKVDQDKRHMEISKKGEAGPVAVLDFDQKKDHEPVWFWGSIGEKTVKFQMEESADMQFPLLTRGFHWINELPFNR